MSGFVTAQDAASKARASTDAVGTLAELALGLTRSLSSEDRFERLLDAIVGAIPCDVAAMLRLEGGALQAVAVRGLDRSVLRRPFEVARQPRLAAILSDRHPVRFAADDARLDPYDGLMTDAHVDLRVHSCMGCSLYVGDRLVGALTLDARDPGQFDQVDEVFFRGLAAMTAASMQVAGLLDLLERDARAAEASTQDLISEAFQRSGDTFVGESPAAVGIREEVTRVAPSSLSILIHGEIGTGKELVARTLHARSDRAHRPLVYVDCGALSDENAARVIFGCDQGPDAGPSDMGQGKMMLADEGTLFLDEVAALPLSVQPTLLRVLQRGELQRVGSEKIRRVDVRVLATTNRDLSEAVRAGRFHADLYQRLSVYPVHIPPLRERREDVRPLAQHLLRRVLARVGVTSLRLAEDALGVLEAGDWPLNVAGLEHTLTRAALGVARDGGVVISAAHLRAHAPDVQHRGAAEMLPQRVTSLRAATDDLQRALVEDALKRHHGSWTATAAELSVDRANLHRLARRLGLKNPSQS